MATVDIFIGDPPLSAKVDMLHLVDGDILLLRLPQDLIHTATDSVESLNRILRQQGLFGKVLVVVAPWGVDLTALSPHELKICGLQKI
jgi:hypothetical protein